MSRRSIALAALVCGTSGWFGCAERAPPTADSAILITIDTLSAKALGCYGGPPGLTPHIDRLAGESLVFRNARTVAPLTLPAHASMLTGLYPPRHRLRDNGLRALPASARTLAERCREAGAQTAAFVSAAVLDRAFALDQGFEVYDAPPRPTQQTTTHYSERPARQTLERARTWLSSRDPERPFFLWVHLYDPHVPYQAPEAFARRAATRTDFGDLRSTDMEFLRAYLGEVAYVDDAVGAFLAPLEQNGTLASTALLLTSDHGESLGLHGEPTHGAFCYDATLQVPLMLRMPDGFRAGDERSDPVSVVDVFPTLLDVLGIEASHELEGDGVSLLGPQPSRAGVYCESYSGFLNYGWSPLAGWCDETAKYLHSSRPELYALEADPREQVDVLAARGRDTSAYESAIAELYQRDALPLDEGELQLSDELLRDLRSLGYGAMGSELDDLPHPLEPSTRPSPADRADELQPLLVANALAAAGDYEPSIQLLERILANNPGHLLALDYLGFGLMQTQEFERALEILEQRLRLGLPRADTYINVATCKDLLGDAEGARAGFENALELDPESFQALEALVRICRAAGDEESATRYESRLAAVRPQTIDGRE